MLAVTSYPEVYVQLTTAKVDEQLAAYAALVAAVKGNAKAGAALAAFAPGYFNTMLLALDHHFMHRMRGAEGKDGNPLNEVRMLSDSIMEHDGVLKDNRTIKYKAEKAAPKKSAASRRGIARPSFSESQITARLAICGVHSTLLTSHGVFSRVSSPEAGRSR